MPTRKASASWEGGLKGGKGTFTGESGAIGGAYSFGSRFEEAGGSNPEELLAAAEAACTVEKVGDGFKITRVRLVVRVVAPDVDEESFRRAAEATKDGCPVSQALRGYVQIELDAALER